MYIQKDKEAKEIVINNSGGIGFLGGLTLDNLTKLSSR